MSRVHLFIGGIIQGSKREMAVHDQGYREEIATIVRHRHPEVEIVDPVQLHPNSVGYDRPQAVRTFLELLDQAAEADLLVAYLPEASLGTALEIWRAYEADKPVFVISPMANNWMLWATARHIFPDIAAFAEFVAQGNLAPYIGR
jgi:DNA-binding transcriptional LysR family regulator